MSNGEPARRGPGARRGLSPRAWAATKLLLDLGGRTVVQRTVQAAIDSGADRVVAVLGHEADLVRPLLDGLACDVIVNPDHARGVGTSLHAGIRAGRRRRCRDRAAGGHAVRERGDDPRGGRPLPLASGARLVLSHYGDVQAPPTLYARELCVAEVLAEPDERCGKRIAKRHADEAVIVPWPESALRDIDVAADYEDVRAAVRPTGAA